MKTKKSKSKTSKPKKQHKEQWSSSKDCIRPLAELFEPQNFFPPSLRKPNLGIEYDRYEVEKCRLRLLFQFGKGMATEFEYRLSKCKERLGKWRDYARQIGADIYCTDAELQEFVMDEIELKGMYDDITDEFGITRKYLLMLADELEGKDADPKKRERKSKFTKITLISNYLKEFPLATSQEIGTATGIKAAGVRKLWKPIKKAQRKTKRNKHKSLGDGDITQAIDETAECSICLNPKQPAFECQLCKEIITTECRTCHYTNSHTDDAIP